MPMCLCAIEIGIRSVFFAFSFAFGQDVDDAAQQAGVGIEVMKLFSHALQPERAAAC